MPRHEVSIQEGYAIWASSYDEEKNPLIAVEQPRVEALFATLPPIASVLDVAAGTGRYALSWARRGASVTAIDQSPDMLAVAREKAEAERLPIDFLQRSIEDGLPFPDDSFDLVICALALCHVPDLAQGVWECSRVLRKGGHLLITDFHPEVIEFGWQTSIARGDEVYLLPNVLHTRSAYLQAVESSGCRVVHLDDVPVREAPKEYVTNVADVDAFMREHGHRVFCLIILAQRSV